MQILLIDGDEWKEWLVDERAGNAIETLLRVRLVPNRTGLGAIVPDNGSKLEAACKRVDELEKLAQSAAAWEHEAKRNGERIIKLTDENTQLKQSYRDGQGTWLSHTENLNKEIDSLLAENNDLREKLMHPMWSLAYNDNGTLRSIKVGG